MPYRVVIVIIEIIYAKCFEFSKIIFISQAMFRASLCTIIVRASVLLMVNVLELELRQP